MPTFNLKDLDIRTITHYESLLNDFNEKIKSEEKKYPLSDREKVFVETIRELLNTLDNSCRREYEKLTYRK